MIRRLKHGRDPHQKASDAAQVKATVENILADVEKRGDEAIRELSEKFDKWAPESFHLSDREISACVSALMPRDIEEIKFAQSQVRAFAERQRAALQDIEVEFFKTCTYQRMTTDEASALIGEYCSCLCILEGSFGHAEQANVRVRRYGWKQVSHATASI
jgi:histidinol dehydrogenase